MKLQFQNHMELCSKCGINHIFTSTVSHNSYSFPRNYSLFSSVCKNTNIPYTHLYIARITRIKGCALPIWKVSFYAHFFSKDFIYSFQNESALIAWYPSYSLFGLDFRGISYFRFLFHNRFDDCSDVACDNSFTIMYILIYFLAILAKRWIIVFTVHVYVQ